jgi:hypothetical protein
MEAASFLDFEKTNSTGRKTPYPGEQEMPV